MIKKYQLSNKYTNWNYGTLYTQLLLIFL